MLHACGGSGFKRDMELERYLRDGKAGWVMGPTNEVLRQFVGKAVLLGFDSLDYWNQAINQRAIDNEVKKLDADGKRALAERLLAEATAPTRRRVPQDGVTMDAVARQRSPRARPAVTHPGSGALPRARPGERWRSSSTG